jgi:choice-of-anchor B domain-containing protein
MNTKFTFKLLFFTLFLISCSKELIPNDNNNDSSEGSNSTVDVSDSTTICEDSFGGKYPCKGFDLLAHINLSSFEAKNGNDSWGWTDPTTDKEYVLMGLDNGTAFVDISDPKNPVLLGKLPTETESSSWRDIKVYNNYAYIVSEASNHGIQIFDLTRLRTAEAPQNFTADKVLKSVPTAHNMVINEESGYGYVVGTDRNDQYSGGVHFLDVNDPLGIRFVGGYADAGYSHDAQVVTYNGPDNDYTGKEIFLGSNENKLSIVDVSDKENPKIIAETKYQNTLYTHQGWFDKTQRYFITGDERDEYSLGGKTRTLIFDLKDLDNPVLHHTYYGTTNAIDHNGYVNGDLLYLANYTAGVRVIAIDDLENKNMSEIGFFDSYPENNAAIFSGAWNVYPFFNSGVIAISDINGGLFLIKKSE